MRRFVMAFNDGHLTLRPHRGPTGQQEKLKVDVLSRHTPPANACATLDTTAGGEEGSGSTSMTSLRSMSSRTGSHSAPES